MKSIRLNESMREDIVNSMLKAWDENNPYPYDSVALEHAVADKIYEDAFSQYGVALAAIPTKFLNISNQIKASIAGNIWVYTMSEVRPVLPNINYDKPVSKIYDDSFAEHKALIEANKANRKHRDERDEFRSEIYQLVKSVNTTKQLVEVWPEAEQYLPPYAADPSKGVNLPMLATSRLNEKLGIK